MVLVAAIKIGKKITGKLQIFISVKNQDLWVILDQLTIHKKVKWDWVKGKVLRHLKITKSQS